MIVAVSQGQVSGPGGDGGVGVGVLVGAGVGDGVGVGVGDGDGGGGTGGGDGGDGGDGGESKGVTFTDATLMSHSLKAGEPAHALGNHTPIHNEPNEGTYCCPITVD